MLTRLIRCVPHQDEVEPHSAFEASESMPSGAMRFRCWAALLLNGAFMPKTATTIPITYDDLGQGEPALLLMGDWCGSRNVFRGLAAALGQHRRTLALDWRGHGESGAALAEFGEEELVEDALSVIEASEAEAVIPVALAQAGWIAVELRRQLGHRIPKLVLVDWLVLGAPPPFWEALRKLQSPQHWRAAATSLFQLWRHGVRNPTLDRYLDDMGACGFELWARAARAIRAAYEREESPLKALTRLTPSVRVLHLYSRSDDPAFQIAQEAFAIENPWFNAVKLDARSHFPMFEIPEDMARIIEEFTATPEQRLEAHRSRPDAA